MTKRYFIGYKLSDREIEEEVTLEEFCQAERQAGFHPKLSPSDPEYMTTPATAAFGNGVMSGRIEYGEDHD